ncbi:major facilitator superfamily MFS_1 [Olsenella uli DSM 7084]|uniref:Major facilitator superfamily MFS_1 n=1 Tax=Olsenella uli (strain ATCC 49627 / DSM 7084 / CCUG 31166 / CIP 109912 / JCM 12494 / LMG 11480 / NCIMB 702895 / VPI D76D-27C) TaxID=633147 RepID=E1QVI4_OLSUV|nr:MFS transporter [Olsenella uli]ADK68137.1 major facilitator superfamily MFS_1 [Olsenella uli DSM 7084]EUB32719.1 transporter, major facilitator family protein [Olsenella uli MSTE5]KRO13066.1 major facilitator superfamily protein [Olsenella uli DSM 7084]MBS6418373.1 MFS transporter [Olsenella uli]
MEKISKETAKRFGTLTVIAAWLAVFCLFGYRSSFSIMQKDLMGAMGWTSTQASLGYCFMMTFYAITAFFSGRLIDSRGTRPTYFIGAICCFLGFFLTSFIPEGAPFAFPVYLVTYGIFAGIGTGMLWVSSTISCRKWYVGAKYGSAWGLAFMGAPMAQLLLTIVISPVLKDAGWSVGMKILSVIMAVMLIVAALVAKPMPDKLEDEGGSPVKPFGFDSLPKKAASAKPARSWSLGEAFRTKALWLDIFAFMFAVMGEFLIWSQIVLFFANNFGWDKIFPMEGTPLLGTIPLGNLIYMLIGLAGIFAMPLTGKFSDNLVRKMGDERRARKIMLVIAPACGIIGCLLALTGNIPLVCLGMIILAIYWGIEPGGAAGYAGTVFGGASLGKIWGLATLIIMGIGPSFGTFMGAFLPNATGIQSSTLFFGMGAFVVSLLCGALLPTKVEE